MIYTESFAENSFWIHNEVFLTWLKISYYYIYIYVYTCACPVEAASTEGNPDEYDEDDEESEEEPQVGDPEVTTSVGSNPVPSAPEPRAGPPQASAPSNGNANPAGGDGDANPTPVETVGDENSAKSFGAAISDIFVPKFTSSMDPKYQKMIWLIFRYACDSPRPLI